MDEELFSVCLMATTRIFASFLVLKAHIDVLLMDRQVIITAARKNVKRIGPRMLFHTDGTTNSLDNIFHCEFNLKMSV